MTTYLSLVLFFLFSSSHSADERGSGKGKFHSSVLVSLSVCFCLNKEQSRLFGGSNLIQSNLT